MKEIGLKIQQRDLGNKQTALKLHQAYNQMCAMMDRTDVVMPYRFCWQDWVQSQCATSLEDTCEDITSLIDVECLPPRHVLEALTNKPTFLEWEYVLKSLK